MALNRSITFQSLMDSMESDQERAARNEIKHGEGISIARQRRAEVEIHDE